MVLHLGGPKIRSDPDVLVVRLDGLLEQGCHLRLATEAAEHHAATVTDIVGRRHPVGPAGDTITVAVLGICVGENRLRWDRLDQPDPEHRRGQPARVCDSARDRLGLDPGDGASLDLRPALFTQEVVAISPDPDQRVAGYASSVATVA